MPDVVGLTEKAAKITIKAAFCTPGRITRKYSTARPKGRVLSQRPRVNFVVEVGTKVNLTVSKGRKPKRRGH